MVYKTILHYIIYYTILHYHYHYYYHYYYYYYYYYTILYLRRALWQRPPQAAAIQEGRQADLNNNSDDNDNTN